MASNSACPSGQHIAIYQVACMEALPASRCTCVCSSPGSSWNWVQSVVCLQPLPALHADHHFGLFCVHRSHTLAIQCWCASPITVSIFCWSQALCMLQMRRGSSSHELPLQEFVPVARELEKNWTRFTPHYIVWVCPRMYRNSEECQSQCIHKGRYCTPDPDGDLGKGYSGKDVVQVPAPIYHTSCHPSTTCKLPCAIPFSVRYVCCALTLLLLLLRLVSPSHAILYVSCCCMMCCIGCILSCIYLLMRAISRAIEDPASHASAPVIHAHIEHSMPLGILAGASAPRSSPQRHTLVHCMQHPIVWEGIQKQHVLHKACLPFMFALLFA